MEEQVQKVITTITKDNSEETKPILLEGIRPSKGENGRFEWSEAFDPEHQYSFCDEQDEKGRASFYDRSSVTLVAKDEIIGILHPPTEGQPGQDIFGNGIESKPGADYKIEPGKNVELQADGRTFIATCSGEPKLQGNILLVEPVITIKSNVDFSTGNIEYNGDVHVNGDIKDLFEVHAGGNIDVGGTIEAAQVHCAGNLTVRRGISGKEKGTITVRKNLSAKYLSNVTVWIQGDAAIQSEIVNTELNVKGKILLERGGISGGHITAAGDIKAPVIGSPAGVRTIVKAAVDPFLQQKLQELEALRVELSDEMTKLMPKAKAMLKSSGGKPCDRLKILAEEIQTQRDRIEEIDSQCEILSAEMAKICTGIIIVKKRIYPGTVLYVGETMQMIDHEITGPLEVVIHRNKGAMDTLEFRSPAVATA